MRHGMSSDLVADLALPESDRAALGVVVPAIHQENCGARRGIEGPHEVLDRSKQRFRIGAVEEQLGDTSAEPMAIDCANTSSIDCFDDLVLKEQDSLSFVVCAERAVRQSKANGHGLIAGRSFALVGLGRFAGLPAPKDHGRRMPEVAGVVQRPNGSYARADSVRKSITGSSDLRVG